MQDILVLGAGKIGALISGLLAESVPGAASVNLLMLAGTVIGGWQMARAALAATRRLADGDPDPAFFEAKLITARFYAEHILPRSSAYSKAAIAGSETMMALPEESF